MKCQFCGKTKNLKVHNDVVVCKTCWDARADLCQAETLPGVRCNNKTLDFTCHVHSSSPTKDWMRCLCGKWKIVGERCINCTYLEV